MDIQVVEIGIEFKDGLHMAKCQGCGCRKFYVGPGPKAGKDGDGWKHVAKCFACLRVKHATHGEVNIVNHILRITSPGL